MTLKRILAVDDEEGIRHVLQLVLTDAGYDVRTVATAEEALEEVKVSEPDLVLTDVRLPGMSGLELLAALKDRAPSVMVIVMSAYGATDAALEAMKAGAYDYISKPFRAEEVVLVLRKAEEREQLLRENKRLRQKAATGGVGGLIGDSPVFLQALKHVRKVADVKTTTLILGESGTGKELVARALHDLSPRKDGPFLAVNCGAIPENLMESELFGHVRGAFTDAHSTRKGLFEEADGGTLFLDEVGELPMSMQVKLLRVLQEEEIRRVGDSRSIKIDVRVVAATVRDLPAEVKKGGFREDLFYRLNVVQLRLPALRERADDIPKLLAFFIDRFNVRLGSNVKGFSVAAMARLQAYGWPGNVRELENVVERAMVLADETVIDVDGLPERLLAATPATPVATPEDGDLSIKRAARAQEQNLIRRALERTKGNRTRAAELLELSHRALLYKLKDYGIT